MCLLSDPSTLGAGYNGPNQHISRIQYKEVCITWFFQACANVMGSNMFVQACASVMGSNMGSNMFVQACANVMGSNMFVQSCIFGAYEAVKTAIATTFE